ncbi:MAG: hypothetical protein FWG90_01620 [Oscillospiraceae bacterium]|nr:hypothetical protein [Oscillospiraceae bacterium]
MKRFLSVALCIFIAFGFAGGLVTPPRHGLAVTAQAEAASEIKMPYHYNALGAEEKQVYQALRNAVLGCAPTLVVNRRVTQPQLSRMVSLLELYDPLTFNLVSISGTSQSGRTDLELTYKYSKEDYGEMMKLVESAADEIMKNMPANISDYDKLLYFHDTIIDGCDYDLEAPHCENIYGALVDGRAKCVGYAQAFTYLCNKSGITSLTVIGDDPAGGDMGHMWNKVRYKGMWYNVDTTYDDPVVSITHNKQYHHFMVSDAALKGTHLEDKKMFKAPEATDDSVNYFAVKGLLAETEAEGRAILRREMIRATSSQTPVVFVKFSSRAEYERAKLRWYVRDDIYSIIINVNKGLGQSKIIEDLAVFFIDDRNQTITVMFFYHDTELAFYYIDTEELSLEIHAMFEEYGIK